MSKDKTPPKPEQKEVGFVNPLTPGVSYEKFLAAIPEGVSVKEYCTGNLTDAEISALEADLKHYQ